MVEVRENIFGFFKALNDANIDYILIKNIGGELPDNLTVGKDIDLLINQNSQQKFRKLMTSIGREVNHPFSKYNGWLNLYGLPDFEFWRLYKGQEMLIDVTYMLCCMSLMPNTWIPLDKSIQDNAWLNKKWDDGLSCWIMDNNTSFVYYIARCIFDKKGFSDKYEDEIAKLNCIIDSEKVDKMLNQVFFKFTPYLRSYINNNKFSDIRDAYISFMNY